MKTIIKIFLVVVFTIVLNGCKPDLTVDNTNQPDEEKALSDPDVLLTIGEGSFYNYWYATHTINAQLPALVAADQFTASWANFAWLHSSLEPRVAWDNTINADNDRVTYNLYNLLYAALSQAKNYLKGTIANHNKGIYLKTDNQTMAMCYFIHGLCLGQLGLTFDKSKIVDENTEDATKVVFSPYPDVIAASIESLKKSIAICDTVSFKLPSTSFNTTNVDNKYLKQLCSSYIARFMVLSSRNKAENNQVVWADVLKYANQGITKDFSILNEGFEGYWYDLNMYYLVRPDWARVDCRIINMLDPAYPKEYPSDGKAPKIHGDLKPGQATSDDARLATDFEFLPSVNFLPERGYYHFSHYRYKRFDTTALDIAPGYLIEFRKYENDLYIAEAKAMTGDLSGALDILNNPDYPRKLRGKLTELTTSQKETVLKAIFYERDIELMGQGFLLGFCDMRRRDMLQFGTFLHFPVPGQELEALQMKYYTFGGVSNADGINTSNGGWFK